MNDLELKYYDFLISENEKYNLTNITSYEEAEVKHFIDSYKLGECFDLTKDITLCDVGSGAGFPSIPLKLKYPNLKIVIIESMKKRCDFLQKLIDLLNLEDVKIICARCEDLIDLREQFDIVTARAVAQLPILMEICSPLVKVGGFFAPLKGSNFEEEIILASNASRLLNLKLIDVYKYELISNNGNSYGHHAIIKYEKVDKTDIKYPRPFGQIKKKSL